ncbi:cyclodeaminase/cyclohydrolase family protein [Pseudomonas sp. W03]|uniref:cyclodeaminase/cyclohydrolase family protein n=1 Tax=Pseudomonas sp. W03 TaxID=3090666 RepID=UPI003A4E2FCB
MQQIELKDTEQQLLERPTNQLLNDFGAGRASPGSGSAAALLGLLAAKMINTVCDISANKAECIDNHKEFGFIKKAVLEQIEPRLKELFELDAKDFERVVELRVLRDKSTDPNEKKRFSTESSDLLEKATDYTFEIADISLRLMRFGITMFEHGWSAIRGDSGVAISSAMASVMSSIFITNLNLKTLKKRKYASDNLKKLQGLQSNLNELQTKAFSCVTAISAESLESIQLELETESADK